jgi:hypothetical protein
MFKKNIHREVIKHLTILLDDSIQVLSNELPAYKNQPFSRIKLKLETQLNQAQTLKRTIETLYRGVKQLNKSKVFKIGLDVHGVIDDDPILFNHVSSLVLASGGEVHIVTGQRDDEKLRKQLADLKIRYTHLFSITTYHESIGTPMTYSKNGNPWMDIVAWNRTKGDYAEKEKLDFHVDDSDEYRPYFISTKFIRYRPKLLCQKWICTKCSWKGRYSECEHVTYKGINWEHCPSCHDAIAIPVIGSRILI